ncbi:MAG: hypothetical protein EPO16_04740 [Dehalococcoidia bacterium]|nr:MAG: hypothetical protein EPO16_04740 [Dehalococcoidia bacterium]
MQAITTKYLPPTDAHGSRIKATCEGGSVTVPYPHEKREGAEAHSVAALELCRKMGWAGTLIAGGTQTGYVFVFRDSPAWDVFESPITQDEANAITRQRLDAIV